MSATTGSVPPTGSVLIRAVRPYGEGDPIDVLVVDEIGIHEFLRVFPKVFKGAHTSLTVVLDNGSTLVAQIDPVALSHIEGDDVWVGWRDRDAVLLAK